MAQVVLIMGRSGTGKSTSIKSLDPKETVVINPLGKTLPFKGSMKSYNKENKNSFQVTNWSDIINYLKMINDKATHVKNIILDDILYCMRTEYFDRSTETGYKKYSDLADHMRKIIQTATTLRTDLNVFMMWHTEEVTNDRTIIGYKCATVGALLDKQFKPDETVTIALYAQPKFDDKGIPTFGFYTHKVLERGIELPCKTPEGMFEEDFIPNDLGFVIKAMNEYYGC